MKALHKPFCISVTALSIGAALVVLMLNQEIFRMPLLMFSAIVWTQVVTALASLVYLAGMYVHGRDRWRSSLFLGGIFLFNAWVFLLYDYNWLED